MKKKIIIVSVVVVILLGTFSIKVLNQKKIMANKNEVISENATNKNNADNKKEESNFNKEEKINKEESKDNLKSKENISEPKEKSKGELKEKKNNADLEKKSDKYSKSNSNKVENKTNNSQNNVKYVTVPNILNQSCNSVYVKLWHTPGIIPDENPKFVDSKLPPNTVISQDPAPGTRVQYGTKLTFVCSRECKLNEKNPYYDDILPDVVGMSEGKAMYKLNKMGFGMITEVVKGPKNLTGKVAKTSPSAGTKIKPNQWVTLYIYNKVTSADEVTKEPIN